MPVTDDVDASLTMWVVYRHPRDFPGQYVARRFEIRGPKIIATPEIVIAPSLKLVREPLERRYVRIERFGEDEPHIVECWI